MWEVEDSKMTYVAKRNLTESYELKLNGAYYMEAGYQVTDPEETIVGANFIENLELIILENTASTLTVLTLVAYFTFAYNF